MEIVEQIQAIGRRVAQRSSETGPTVVVTTNRRFRAPVGEVWAALTEPERIGAWFLPVTGDLRAGGSYQLEANATEDILTCEPPVHLRVTFGGPSSIVDLRLTADGAETLVELDQTVPLEMAGTSAGALYVGPGWDSALTTLALHLSGELVGDPVAAASSPEAQAFGMQSVDAWVTVITASGTTDPLAVDTARKTALEQFAPDITHPH